MEKTLHTGISFLHIGKTSLLIVTGMIGFFFLMGLFNLHSILDLRFLNFLFIFFGVRHVLLHQQHTEGSKIKLHPAMMLGFLTVFVIAALFSTFIFIYLNIDNHLMALIKLTQPFGAYLSPASSAMVIFLEGITSGAIVAIPVLRTMKRERAAMATESVGQLAN